MSPRTKLLPTTVLPRNKIEERLFASMDAALADPKRGKLLRALARKVAKEKIK